MTVGATARRRFGVAARYAYELDRIGFLSQSMAEFGDVFPMDRRRWVVCDPALIHEILVGTGGAFAAGHDALHGFVPEAPELVDAWMRGRRVAWHGVGPAMLAAYAGRLNASFGRTLAELAGQEIAVVTQAQVLMSRAAVDFCISHDNEALADAVAAASLAQLAVQDTVAPALSRLPFRVVRRGREADRMMRLAIDACIARRGRIAPARRPLDVLDVLDVLRSRGEFTDENIARVLKRILVGSHGVPGAALSWLIRELGLRPQLAAAIQTEAHAYAEAIATGSPVVLPYTDAAVKELLRLYPPIWLMVREVREPTTLGPWHAHPRDQVLLPIYLVHRDPRWWPQPERFCPERWLDGQPHVRHTYLPFGSGPRMCLGYRLGSLQLVLAAGVLANQYRIELTNTEQAPPTFNAILTPLGLRARLHPY
jgi:enediyne biosynthesis protein E7